MQTKKTLIIFIAIALLGLAGFYVVKQPKDSSPTATTSKTTSKTSTKTTKATGKYKDGTFTGSNVRSSYGYVKISIKVSSGKISNVSFITLPDLDQRTRTVSSYASPILEERTISKQSADIDLVSGATYTSRSYIESLQAALDKAKI